MKVESFCCVQLLILVSLTGISDGRCVDNGSWHLKTVNSEMSSLSSQTCKWNTVLPSRDALLVFLLFTYQNVPTVILVSENFPGAIWDGNPLPEPSRPQVHWNLDRRTLRLRMKKVGCPNDDVRPVCVCCVSVSTLRYDRICSNLTCVKNLMEAFLI